MVKRDDSIFQLSLTEIAFTLVFVLLILLGWMFSEVDKQRKNAEQRLTQTENLFLYKESVEALNRSLQTQLDGTGIDANDVVTQLTDKTDAEARVEALQKRLDNMDAEISALTEIKAVVEETKNSSNKTVVAAELATALALKKKIEDELISEGVLTAENASDGETMARENLPGSVGVTPVASGQSVESHVLSALRLRQQLATHLKGRGGELLKHGSEIELAEFLVNASRTDRIKENADLRGQIAFLTAKIEARGGRDFPPCWANESTGKVEYLFNIEITTDGLRVTPAWNANRHEDGMQLPNVEQIINNVHSIGAFTQLMQGIFAISKSKDCRHYTYLRNQVNDLAYFNRHRYAVESFFYKLEIRR